MNKLNFEPAVNRIGEDYFVCPKNETDWQRVLIKTDRVGAFLVCLMQNEITEEDMLAAAQAEFPDESYDTLKSRTAEVRSRILKTSLEENKLEVIEV